MYNIICEVTHLSLEPLNKDLPPSALDKCVRVFLKKKEVFNKIN